MTPSDERRDLEELDRMLDGLAGEMAGRLTRRQRRRRVARRVGFVLAAATVAGSIWLGPDPAPVAAPAQALDVASSRPFAVFPTSRSNITVIWLLSPEEP